MTYTVELDLVDASPVMAQVLEEDIEMLKKPSIFPLFSHNKKEEKRLVKKLIRAMEITRLYYKAGGNVKELLENE